MSERDSLYGLERTVCRDKATGHHVIVTGDVDTTTHEPLKQSPLDANGHVRPLKPRADAARSEQATVAVESDGSAVTKKGKS